MRVAFVADALGAGGAQKMMAFVINSVSDFCDNILIILQDDKGLFYSLPCNSKIVTLQCEKKIEKYPNSRFWKLKSLYDRIHETKTILKKFNIDIVCGFGAYYSTIAVLAAQKRIKTLVSERRSPAHLDMFWQLFSSWIYRKANMVVFQTKGAQSFYKKLNSDHTCVIPNPYLGNIERPIIRVEETRKVIAMAAARLEYEKGFDVGIKAMYEIVKTHPDYSMEIYGKGDFDGLFGDLITNLGLNNKIVYKGLSKNVIDDICDVSVFILPSRIEGIPNILLEAIGAGIPCVAADCPPGGAHLLIGENEYGLLVPVENEGELANSVNKMIEDPKLQNAYKSKTKEFRERFNADAIAELWRDAFSKSYK